MDSESDSSLEPLPKLKRKAKETTHMEKQDDLEFVINYRRNLTGKMNWKMCLEAGHKKKLKPTLLQRRIIRSFFYNATKK
ncbi:uncharacterized protein BX664DRAFT_343052 [Halteromyces radiatus]|uniref:uncharacterized protein n=1 Tax=Halteromyces radiatus TaxID=101107 RepID=UPI00221E9535|nr:uncharacterized protein BX664DRAFT_343052 [Halteromyces radiatus]KAI8078911.1 hypothetical protein BX664DRAFT_343052 [Halteromyces radiatus]